MTPEQIARERITAMLKNSGWIYEEYALTGRRNGSGFADYLLFDSDGIVVVVLEAKQAEVHPLSGKEQAREYADSISVKHVFLSNGLTHYHWNINSGSPNRIMQFPKPAELNQMHYQKSIDRSQLWNIVMDEKYIKGVTMRDYQVEAIRALQESAKRGRSDFLLRMATGTGKTVVAAAICRLYLQSGVAKRILFLVDRDELYEQAADELSSALNRQYRVVGLREYEKDPSARIVVATVQSLNAAARDGEPVPPEFFQLIISDEAHRSISGPSHRDVFNTFKCDKIGLTATPRQYLINYNTGDVADIADLEAKLFRDTYVAFGMDPMESTFEYTIEQAVTDGYLVMPHAVDVRTDVTAQLMSDEGFYGATWDYDKGEYIERKFHAKDYGNLFLSPDTNREFAEQFLEYALREPGTDIIGKSIIYCASIVQAAQLTNELNKVAEVMWPGRYNSDFAVQVTHDVDRATEMGRDFAKKNSLNGFDETIQGYKTSKTRVCVTVAMMITGYDCPDLLNLGFCRPVKSLTDYIQMKGRGTRKYNFTDNITDQLVRNNTEPRPKEYYLIIDYFGVCEFFNETDLYTKKPLRSHQTNTGDRAQITPAAHPNHPYINYGKDNTESVVKLSMGVDGGITDRERILEEHEALNRNLAQEFERYLEQHPAADIYLQDDMRRLFEAYATEEDVRNAIDNQDLGALSGAITVRQYARVPDEHRMRIPEYIKSLNLEIIQQDEGDG